MKNTTHFLTIRRPLFEVNDPGQGVFVLGAFLADALACVSGRRQKKCGGILEKNGPERPGLS